MHVFSHAKLYSCFYSIHLNFDSRGKTAKGLFPGAVAVCRVGFACLQADLSLQLKLVPEKTTVLGEGSLGSAQDLAALLCWSQSRHSSCCTSF